MSDFRARLVRSEGGFPMFNTLIVGPFSVSIQASEFHYCRPRATLERASDYDAFEVAIFEDERWVQPRNDPRFWDESWAKLFETIDNPVAAAVPVPDVEAVLASLAKHVN